MDNPSTKEVSFVLGIFGLFLSGTLSSTVILYPSLLLIAAAWIVHRRDRRFASAYRGTKQKSRGWSPR